MSFYTLAHNVPIPDAASVQRQATTYSRFSIVQKFLESNILEKQEQVITVAGIY